MAEAKFKVGDKVRVLPGVPRDFGMGPGDEDVVTDKSNRFITNQLYYVGYNGSLFYESELELVAPNEEPKKVTRKQVDKVLRAAKKANDIYANPNSDYEDYATACDDLHKILEKIANG